MPERQFDTTFQASNVMAYMRGSHNVRGGFDLRRLATGRRAANDPRGLFSFNGDISGYPMADFMLGLPRTVIPPTHQIQGHVNDGNPNASLDAAAFGRITTAGSMLQVQLGGKLLF